MTCAGPGVPAGVKTACSRAEASMGPRSASTCAGFRGTQIAAAATAITAVAISGPGESITAIRDPDPRPAAASAARTSSTWTRSSR